MSKGKIPIAEGQRMSEKYDAPIVIVFSLHGDGSVFNVTTYGASKALCRHAADLGSKIASAILGSKIAPSEVEPQHLPNQPTQWTKAAPSGEAKP